MSDEMEGIRRLNHETVLRALSARPSSTHEYDEVTSGFAEGEFAMRRSNLGTIVVLGRSELAGRLAPAYSIKILQSPSAITHCFNAAGTEVDFLVVDEDYLRSSIWRKFLTSTGRPTGALQECLELAKAVRAEIVVWAPMASAEQSPDFGDAIYLPNSRYDTGRGERPLPQIITSLHKSFFEGPVGGGQR